jgi:hypothetical protein
MIVVAGLAVLIPLGAATLPRPAVGSIEKSRYDSTLAVITSAGLPQTVQADPTLTACRGVGALCARTTKLSPQRAVRSVHDHLREAGLKLGPVLCGAAVDSVDPMALIERIDCVAVSTSLGRVVAVEAADQSRQLTGETTALGYTWVRVTVTRTALFGGDADEDWSGTRASAAPSGVSDLSMLPAWMSRSAVCTATSDSNCSAQKITAQLPEGMTADQAADDLVAALQDEDFNVVERTCHDLTSDAGILRRRCAVSGERFVLRHGQGRIQVVAALSDESRRAVGSVSTP